MPSHCDRCGRSFANKFNLLRHQKKCLNNNDNCAGTSKKTDKIFECDRCDKTFNRRANLKRHEAVCKRVDSTPSDDSSEKIDLENDEYFCEGCEVFVKRRFASQHERTAKHIEVSLERIDKNCSVYQTALDSKLIIYRTKRSSYNYLEQLMAQHFPPDPTQDTNPEIDLNVKLFANSLYHCIEKVFIKELEEKIVIKFRFKLCGLYTNESPNNEKTENLIEESEKTFYSKYRTVTREDNLREVFDEAVEEIITAADEFNEFASGWAVVKLLYIDTEMGQIEVFKSDGGGTFIPLPPEISHKKACINVRNTKDSKCFLYSILAITFYNKFNVRNNREKPATYKRFMDFYNLDGITFPVSTDDIKRFEKNNTDKNVSIRVFVLKNNEVQGPIYQSSIVKENHFNLLLLQKNNDFHYVAIASLSRLVGCQISKHKGKVYLCESCLLHFNRGEDLELHVELGCGKIRTELPEPKTTLEFNNFKAKQRIPFVFYGDLESILLKTDSVCPNPKTSYTRAIQIHTACSFAYSIQSLVEDDDLKSLRLYRNPDCLEVFIKSVISDVKLIYQRYLKSAKPKETITPELDAKLKLQTDCIFCKKPLEKDIVIDHDHFTGRIRGRSHNKCNLACRVPKFIPFLFHAGSSYDFHLLITAFAKETKIGKLECLPRTKERYISFSVTIPMHDDENNENSTETIQIKFLDSYRFLPASIATLAASLSSYPEYTKFHEANFPNLSFWRDPKKQFLPYEYLDSFDRFEETELPPVDGFYSHLSEDTISVEDHAHAVSVFNNLNNRTLGGYIDYYLTIDVLLLQDIFEHFRDTSFRDFNLEPLFFCTLAGFSFNSCLENIDTPIELISDPNMLFLLKNSIRGGIACAMTRYSEANNKYMEGGYNKDKGEPNYLMQIDANALYNFTMQMSLPLNNFKFIEGEEFERVKNNILNIPQDNNVGYIFVCDVIYPKHLHDLHNCLPFLAESKVINGTKKLVPNLYDKTDYVAHYMVLQQALNFGLILKSVKKIIKFNQCKWLKPYMDLCSRLRQVPTNNDFQKLLYKLMANIIFGKMIESIDKYRSVKLITKWKADHKTLDGRKLLKDPRFKSFTIFTEDFVAIEMKRTKVLYNRPTIVGYSILELSKFRMYQFYYGLLQAKLGPENIKICYIDTDSYLLSCKKDIFEFIRNNHDHFDTADYGKDNRFNITPRNNKIPGLFHDEGKGVLLIQFYALRAKAYAMLFENQHLVKKLKSANSSTKAKLQLEDYAKVWRDREVLFAKMFRIQSKLHVLETIEINRKTLSGDDDKRYICSDNIHTLALGHKDIPQTL